MPAFIVRQLESDELVGIYLTGSDFGAVKHAVRVAVTREKQQLRRLEKLRDEGRALDGISIGRLAAIVHSLEALASRFGNIDLEAGKVHRAG